MKDWLEDAASKLKQINYMREAQTINRKAKRTIEYMRETQKKRK